MSLLLLLAFPARGAGLPESRASVAVAESGLAASRGRRAEVERSLGEVSGRVESLKSERAARGALFGDSELDRLLQRSQELSARLTELLRAERVAEESAGAGRAQLSDALDRDIARLRGSWDATAREERQGLVARIRELRAERDALRRTLPAAPVPRLSEALSDDPEELLERADALLDGEDKLRREERALAVRIVELGRERELERRMSDFLNEGSLFDEHDRRISINRPARSAAESTSPEPPRSGDPVTLGADRTGTVATPGAPIEGASETANFDGQPGDRMGGNSATGTAVPGPRTAPEPGRQPSLGEVGDDGGRRGLSRTPPERRGAAPYFEDETLEELEARQVRVRTLADQLHRKAEEAAAKARSLR